MTKFCRMPSSEYFSDPCEVPSLTQSVARTLLDRSPLHAWREHPKLGNKVKREPTSEMIRGTVVHSLLLEGHAKDVAVGEFKDWRAKAAGEFWDSAIAVGRTPMLQKDFTACITAAAAIRVQLLDMGIKLVGESEYVALWTETADDGSEVQCRGLIDHWIAGSILDLKTTGNAHPNAVQKSYIDHGYDIQAAAYRSGASKCFPDLGDIHFVNIFAEMEEPYPVSIVVPDADMLALGKSRWRRAINLWAKCLKTGVWPCYATEPISVSPPKWATDREFEMRLSNQTEVEVAS